VGRLRLVRLATSGMWITVVGTALGALIALAGALLSETLRWRRDRESQQFTAVELAVLDFILSLQEGHDLLQRAAAEPDPKLRQAYVDRCLIEAKVYARRERLLVVAPPEIAVAAEQAFGAVASVRDSLRTAAAVDPSELAWARMSEAAWALRQTLRTQTRRDPLPLDRMRSARSAAR
jgi:hypothetical protein